ncbi:MAG: helix-turn-helix protein [Alphaproteobacteria bacterium]|nr:helix-turn-helix protein [Alphaproteobacteria bacterium]
MAEQGQEQVDQGPIGERLRLAREEKGISLEEVARQTRIPIRHLQHIEQEEWDALPAITYTIGFVRSYANAIGLDGPVIGAELRAQLGGVPRGGPATALYEPADPARVPPRSLAIAAAILAVLLIAAYLTWRHYALGGGDRGSEIVAEAVPGPAPQPKPATPPPAPAAAATGAVVVAATEAVWVRIYEAGAGGKTLFMGTMKAGDRYSVPATASAPEILTGRPNALQVTVGGTSIPPLGPPERRIKDVSLKAADLAARVQPGAPGAAPPAAVAH